MINSRELKVDEKEVLVTKITRLISIESQPKKIVVVVVVVIGVVVVVVHVVVVVIPVVDPRNIPYSLVRIRLLIDEMLLMLLLLVFLFRHNPNSTSTQLKSWV